MNIKAANSYDRIMSTKYRPSLGLKIHVGVAGLHRMCEPLGASYWRHLPCYMDAVQMIRRGSWYVRVYTSNGSGTAVQHVKTSEPLAFREALVRVKLGVGL